MKVMVFDVGGTEIKYSVMDEQMNRFDAGSVPTPQDTQEPFLDLSLIHIFRGPGGGQEPDERRGCTGGGLPGHRFLPQASGTARDQIPDGSVRLRGMRFPR